MNDRIQLDDLIADAESYEAPLLRMPIPEDVSYDSKETAHAAAKTAKDILNRSGVKDFSISEEDAIHATELFNQHMQTHQIPISTINKPETALKLEAILQEYDYKVVQQADQIRTLVVNKLLELSDNRDAKVQLKAVELLGKIADVGMFVDKQEVTYKHQSDEVIQKKLKEKLGLLIEGEIVQDTIVSEKKAHQLKYPDLVPLPETPKITKDSLEYLINSHE